MVSHEVLAYSRNNFPSYAADCLVVLTKVGKTVPFVMNQAQMHVHKALEAQLKDIGKVRALVLKGRQQGISTYIGGRFYHKTSLNAGQHAFIIAHEQKATDNLYTMVKRYNDHCPLQPHTGVTNAKELIFDMLDGGYKLATAGSVDVGRSNTAQLLHGSEFAFWQNADKHQAGIGNTVADMDGTEIIYESTGNGVGNAFHALWQQAEQGIGEYIPIFVPWFWQDEYRARVPDDFILSSAEAQYQATYGLDMQQMSWRRNKINSYRRGFEWLFDQEYPASPALAFRSTTADPLISPLLVDASVASKYLDKSAPLIIGVDPADGGADRTAIVFRRGRIVVRTESHDNLNNMEIVGLVGKIIREYKPQAVFVDKGGVGAGVYSRLRELNHGNVYGVMFGEGASEKDIYANKRAEMWYRMKEWFEDLPNRIPNDLALVSDLSGPAHKLDSSSKLLLESKADMKKRGIRSPDLGDALALTFAEYLPVIAGGENRGGNKNAGAASSAGY